MSSGPRLVHKQFNSPIGLYSQQNIKETLSKHIQDLGNGTVGIDFNNPNTDKPANLANSAVLRMLEEEERNRRGYPNQKKVVWPPAPETNGYHSPQAHAQHSPAPAQPSPPQHQQPPQQPQQPREQPRERTIPIQIQRDPAPPQHQPPPQYQQSPQYQHSPQYQPAPQYQQSPQYQPAPQYQQTPQYQHAPQYQQSPQYQPAPQYQQAPQPSFCEGRRQEPCGLSKLIPASPQRPGPASPAPQPFTKQPGRWAPVSPQAYGSQPNYPASQQDYSAPPFSPPPEYQKTFSPPPATITLRQQPPVHQKPPPVFASQPAAASFNGGVNMRGDQKWPPREVREAVAAENEARRQLAKGPACRPRKVKKDYTSFFSQHALNNNYPGYRAPPGTQHYEELSGRSSY